MRQGNKRHDFVIVILNFTPVTRKNFTVGVPYEGLYQEFFNSELVEYGGKWNKKPQICKTKKAKFKELNYQIQLDVPGFSAMILKPKDVTIPRHYHTK